MSPNMGLVSYNFTLLVFPGIQKRIWYIDCFLYIDITFLEHVGLFFFVL